MAQRAPRLPCLVISPAIRRQTMLTAGGGTASLAQ